MTYIPLPKLKNCPFCKKNNMTYKISGGRPCRLTCSACGYRTGYRDNYESAIIAHNAIVSAYEDGTRMAAELVSEIVHREVGNASVKLAEARLTEVQQELDKQRVDSTYSRNRADALYSQVMTLTRERDEAVQERADNYKRNVEFMQERNAALKELRKAQTLIEDWVFDDTEDRVETTQALIDCANALKAGRQS
jgi:transcription elongation factor Elf1